MKDRLHDLRRNYGKFALNLEDLKPSPFDQFKDWFNYALEQKVYEANAMTLATVGKNLAPTLRVVLLKDYDDQGFVFFTNYSSKKGKQITENPQGAVNFFWPVLERQVRIEGNIERVPTELSDAYFNSRPLLSKKSAMISPQSNIIESKERLKQKIDAVSEQEVMRPEDWGGYRLRPSYFEFWQGGSDRFHDRFIYDRNEDNWTIHRIAP